MSKKLQNPAKSHEIPIQVFNPFAASKKYSYEYILPSTDLENFVDSHWAMHWDLTADEPFRLELASSPYIAFTFTQYGNYLTGINTGVYGYTISGKGSLYGTLFKPTRFREIFSQPMTELTNKEIPAGTVFPIFDEEFKQNMAGLSDDKEAITSIENALRSLPRISDNNNNALTDEIIDFSLKNPNMTVAQVAKNFKISSRTLHLLFHDYVGVGIKWITVRDRLQKAMFIAAKSETKPNWTTIALALGYNDQSHFINDFKRIIGMSPSRYYDLLARTK